MVTFDVNKFVDMPLLLPELLGTVALEGLLLFLAIRIRPARLAWLAFLFYFLGLVVSVLGTAGVCIYGVDWRWSRSDFQFVRSRILDGCIVGGMALANLGVGAALFRRLPGTLSR